MPKGVRSQTNIKNTKNFKNIHCFWFRRFLELQMTDG